MKTPEAPVTTGAVTSADGTAVGFRRLGQGPALVLMHGSGGYSDRYMEFAQHLGRSFTVYVVDRRGRGLSGPQGAAYCLEREYEDLAAVIEHAGATLVFGHSYGAVVSLGTALRVGIDRLVVYEPPILVRHLMEALLPRFPEQVAAGRYGRAQRTWLRTTGMAGLPLGLLVQFAFGVLMPRRRDWPLVMQAIKANVAEDECIRTQPPIETYGGVSAETLVLVGTKTIPELKRSCEELVRVVPRSQLQWLDGQAHNANTDIPERLAAIVTDFLLAGAGGASEPTDAGASHDR